jgi:DNA mismatch repair protein MutL
MSKIQLLPSTVADQIAAGEVVERPSSVVKELVENYLDAGAAKVEVDLEQAGKRLIRVSDDGEGMGPEDLALSIRRHATSKIRRSEDLQDLRSFGFRGEALPSIASVSKFRLSSRARGSAEGAALQVEGGEVSAPRPEGRAVGSTVEVRDLFFNTPARLKFLKNDATEAGRAQSDLSQLSLAHPGVAFQLRQDGRLALDLPVAAGAERLAGLWGPSLANAALAVEHSEAGVSVTGWVAPPQLSRGNRALQWLYVNQRPVEHRGLGFQLSQAYGSLLPHGRHPVAALFVTVDPGAVDVNVHPAKREVRFRQESAVMDAIRHGVAASLRKADLFKGMDLGQAASFSSGSGEPPGSGEPSRAAWGGGGRLGLNSLSDAGTAVRPWGQGGLINIPTSGEGSGNLLDREVNSAVPSHVQASPWAMNLPRASKPDWPVPLAQLHKTYLLCQDSQGLVVVDQHAAHERVLYERQLKAWAGRAVRTQHLLLPQRMNVSAAQAGQLARWAPQLAELGLEVQDVGGGLFFVSSLPEFLKQMQVAPMLLDLLEHPDGFSQPASGDPAEDFRREAAAQLACKAAIKANDPLTWEAMQQLMADLSACDIPWSCPHGRPPLVRISLVELEKHFLRR